MAVYKCPVCEGKGIVPFGFYTIPQDQSGNTGVNTTPETCKSCNGHGVIHDFIQQQEPFLKTPYTPTCNERTCDEREAQDEFKI